MTSPFAQTVIDTIRKAIPGKKPPIPLHEPCFTGNEWKYTKMCLDTGWVSSVGTFVDRFENLLTEVTGAKHAIAVVNGTSALHICLKLAGVTANDEVILPALSFVATANAIAYCNAVPHFADIEEQTLGLCPRSLERHLAQICTVDGTGCVNKKTGRRIRGVVAVHTFGNPVDLDSLADVCARFRLTLIEDAAESLGSLYKGKHTGNWGLLSSLSFNGNKIVTTGGGGALLTNNKELAQRAKHLTTTAKLPHPWIFSHDQTGYNYRLPNINAALGCAQLENLPSFLEKKRSLALRYAALFQNVNGVNVFLEDKNAQSNYWLNSLILDRNHAAERDIILQLSQEQGIQLRPAWEPLHTLPMYSPCPRSPLPQTESFASRIINIPSSANLWDSENVRP